MVRQRQIELSSISAESCVFWSGGNRPTQILHRLSTREEILHLKALYLLTDRVLAAASFYFESNITRSATKRLRTLFERGEILYFIDNSIEDFAEHGAEKHEKSPTGLASYRNKELVAERAKILMLWVISCEGLHIPSAIALSACGTKIWLLLKEEP